MREDSRRKKAGLGEKNICAFIILFKWKSPFIPPSYWGIPDQNQRHCLVVQKENYGEKKSTKNQIQLFTLFFSALCILSMDGTNVHPMDLVKKYLFLVPPFCSRLDANHITTVPEDSFEGLQQLRHLWLDDNNLTEVPVGSLRHQANLQALTLALNRISYIPDNAFANLTSLVVL